MTQPEKYNLQWDDYQSNMTECFNQFRAGNLFFDVTLVCDDKIPINAHKLLLSACSPFFQSVLNQNSHSHPWIYLKGTKSKDLKLIVDFMYTGEIEIEADDVQNFFAIAKELQIKGLSQDVSQLDSLHTLLGTDPIKSIRNKVTVKNEDPLSTEQVLHLSETANIEYEENIAEHAENAYPNEEFPVHKAQEEYNIKTALIDMIHKTDGMWVCRVCQKQFKNKCMALKHTEKHIEGVSISCEICKKSFRSSNSYQVHMSDYHTEGEEGVSYTCNICWKICKSKPALRMHNNRFHKQAPVLKN